MELVVLHRGDRDPEEVERLRIEAADHVSATFQSEEGGLLPRRPVTARCRLCGSTCKLTKEHVPPKGAGNRDNTRAFTLDDWTAADSLDMNGGETQQGGIWGYTLCRACNSYTGRMYGAEYQAWARRAVLLWGQEEALHPSRLNEKPEAVVVQGTLGGQSDGGVAPGAMARQVLSMMCSVSASWDLAGTSPTVRRIVLDQALEPLPEGMSLWMEFFAGPRTRISGPSLVSERRGSWTWLMEIAHPPFAFVMVLASNYEATFGMNLGEFTTEHPTRRVALDASWQLGFGWTPFPTDLRSRAAIEREDLENTSESLS